MIREPRLSGPKNLVSAETARIIDQEAQTEWGFNSFSLIEAAGRLCAETLTNAFPDPFLSRPRITVAAGAGNNGADAMVMLRSWILSGQVDASSSALVISRMPNKSDTSPYAELLRSLKKMKVKVLLWDWDIIEAAGRPPDDALAHSDIIIDGITGTGIKGPLQGTALEMVKAINSHRKKHRSPNSPFPTPFVVSVDLPSGNSDQWETGMPIVEADLTLAIEPQKLCLYSPAARSYAGIILPVEGIFPKVLTASHGGSELITWEDARERISKIRPDAYKNERGYVEIRAGSPGATGAALIAARGAQAAGAGLVRLITDDEIFSILASQAGGIMVVPAGMADGLGGDDSAGAIPLSKPDAVLLGPGWGLKSERAAVLEKALEGEKKGIPLILDADAIELVRDKVFNGYAILTPHPGEMVKFIGIDKEELLRHPVPILLKLARERNTLIIFKGHVITIAAPDGRLGVVDGMAPGLAAGGSGDLLAGFCAAIAARMHRTCMRTGSREGRGYDPYDCAAAAAALLIASGKSDKLRNRFSDPLELADAAADLAGSAWLKTDF